jgi:hypothetical protein
MSTSLIYQGLDSTHWVVHESFLKIQAICGNLHNEMDVNWATEGNLIT